MEQGWEIFDGKIQRMTEPFISINTSGGGGFGISASFLKTENLDSASGVRLLYNKNNKEIGFQFLPKGMEGSLPLRTAGGSAMLGVKSFFNRYGLSPKALVGRYTPRSLETINGKIYVINLNEKEEERMANEPMNSRTGI